MAVWSTGCLPFLYFYFLLFVNLQLHNCGDTGDMLFFQNHCNGETEVGDGVKWRSYHLFLLELGRRFLFFSFAVYLGVSSFLVFLQYWLYGVSEIFYINFSFSFILQLFCWFLCALLSCDVWIDIGI